MIFVSVLMTAGFAPAHPVCADLFNPDSLSLKASEFSFREILQKNGLDPNLIRFELTPSPRGGFLLRVAYHGARAGWLEVRRFESGGTVYFESHSGVEERFRRKGLGSLLYVTAAKILFRRNRHVLMSTETPSWEASDVWARFIKANLATVYVPTGQFPRRGFRLEVLASQFDDVLQFFDSRHVEIDPDDAY